MRSVLLIVISILVMASVAVADDVYKITTADTQQLLLAKQSGVRLLARLHDGYLVYSDSETATALVAAGVPAELIATNIPIDQLAIDARIDDLNAERFPVLYADGGFRLLQVDFGLAQNSPDQIQAHPVKVSAVEWPLDRPATTRETFAPAAEDLLTLIAEVSVDSLESYVNRLQAFYRRYTGTDSLYASRDWIASKFTEFGYDSVYYDSFEISLGGTVPCENVVAVKPGTKWPGQHIVVGAHYDGVSDSPAADDNGSGTAGVLEIARVLKDVQTDMTFIFVCFAAEELGLHGSYHYANEAYARGDSIVYMLNMDMLGFEDNTVFATLYHGSDLTFTNLWQHLGDSLLGVQGILSGTSGSSDHYPFQQKGYPVTFIIERTFSDVYHSPQDSTTYMDFNYCRLLVQTSLATVYQVNVDYGPQPAVLVSYPEEIPLGITPNQSTTIPVDITTGWEGVLVAGSPTLHYAIDGGVYQQEPLTLISGERYEGSLPAVSCGSQIEYYVTAEEETTGLISQPPSTDPYFSIATTGIVSVFADNFETAQGWTVSGTATDGQWDRGVPAGGGLRGDPPTDFDGSGQCYLTDNVEGNSDVDGGTTILTSPSIDLSLGDALIHYARWYSNDFGANPLNNTFLVTISNDGWNTFDTVEVVGPVEQSSGGWFEHSFWVADILPPTDNIQLRFSASDIGAGAVVEAAIDDVTVSFFECAGCDCGIVGDVNCDDACDPLDVQFLVAYVFQDNDARCTKDNCPYQVGDVDCSGGVDPLDVQYLVAYVFLDQDARCVMCP